MTDFAVDIIAGSTPVVSETKDFTVDLGGRIPKAIVVFGNNGSIAGGFLVGQASYWGAGTATKEWCCSIDSRDNQGTSTCNRRAVDGKVMQRMNTLGTVVLEATIDSFTADTVTLDFTVTGTGNRRIAIMAFAGDDLEVDAQVVALVNGANTITTGFEPNVVIGGSIDQTTFADASVADSLLSQGFASWDGTTLLQASATGMAEDAVVTTSCSGVSSNVALLSTEGIDNGVVVSSVTASGYTATNNKGSDVAVGLLHLKIPDGYRAWGGPVVWSHTAGANVTDFSDDGVAPGLDFSVHAAMMLVARTNSTSWLTGNNTTPGATRSTCGFTSGGDFVSLLATDQTGVATTNTASGAFTDASGAPAIRAQHNQAADITYTSHSMSGIGLEVSSTAVATTANRRCMLLAFGLDPTAPDGLGFKKIISSTP